jgi:hypothetical protein
MLAPHNGYISSIVQSDDNLFKSQWIVGMITRTLDRDSDDHVHPEHKVFAKNVNKRQ